MLIYTLPHFVLYDVGIYLAMGLCFQLILELIERVGLSIVEHGAFWVYDPAYAVYVAP